jgi:hypothetical protein
MFAPQQHNHHAPLAGACQALFVFICTLVRAVTIYLQGAVFAVVIRNVRVRLTSWNSLIALTIVATTRARENKA